MLGIQPCRQLAHLTWYSEACDGKVGGCIRQQTHPALSTDRAQLYRSRGGMEKGLDHTPYISSSSRTSCLSEKRLEEKLKTSLGFSFGKMLVTNTLTDLWLKSGTKRKQEKEQAKDVFHVFLCFFPVGIDYRILFLFGDELAAEWKRKLIFHSCCHRHSVFIF